ncbi:MAG: hypothetical protein PHI48_03755 [Bacteroidales bacterium]|nr:hypothetical protein [Bacteroidales bacterium]
MMLHCESNTCIDDPDQLFDAEKERRTIVRGLFTFAAGLLTIDQILDSQGVAVPLLVKRPFEEIAGRSPQ